MMPGLLKVLHVLAAVVWMGGMALMLLAVRPVALAQLPPAQRVPFLAGVLGRFFAAVWVCIAVLLGSGLWALLAVGMKQAPLGWHLMLGIGLLMMAVFAHLYFAPFARLKRAVQAQDWPAGGQALAQIHPLVVTNFSLSVLALAAVTAR